MKKLEVFNGRLAVPDTDIIFDPKDLKFFWTDDFGETAILFAKDQLFRCEAFVWDMLNKKPQLDA